MGKDLDQISQELATADSGDQPATKAILAQAASAPRTPKTDKLLTDMASAAASEAPVTDEMLERFTDAAGHLLGQGPIGGSGEGLRDAPPAADDELRREVTGDGRRGPSGATAD